MLCSLQASIVSTFLLSQLLSIRTTLFAWLAGPPKTAKGYLLITSLVSLLVTLAAQWLGWENF